MKLPIKSKRSASLKFGPLFESILNLEQKEKKVESLREKMSILSEKEYLLVAHKDEHKKNIKELAILQSYLENNSKKIAAVNNQIESRPLWTNATIVSTLACKKIKLTFEKESDVEYFIASAKNPHYFLPEKNSLILTSLSETVLRDVVLIKSIKKSYTLDPAIGVLVKDVLSACQKNDDNFLGLLPEPKAKISQICNALNKLAYLVKKDTSPEPETIQLR